ncbi:MAG: VWA domain-containing protein, partial [Bacillota bacterium]|nr:VWA domain-containing protein [Bacillota bacterium]
ISGSMQGTPFEQSQVALHACVANLQSSSHLLSLVAYDSGARLVTPLTSDAAALTEGIDSLYPDGGTNIPSGIIEGISSLKGAKGTKAMILLTDGQDGNREEMERAVQTANAENIAIYTVAFGDFDRDYMQSIAKATGGRFIEAQSEEELASIYTMLQGFIVNNYYFEYDVTEVAGDNPRLLEIELKEYRVHDARTYARGDLTVAESGYAIQTQKDALQLVDIRPSSVSVRDLKSGVPIFLHLRGASDALKVSIDDQPVTVKRLDESTWSFVLDDRYHQGGLSLTIEDGDRRLVSREMLRISGGPHSVELSQTIRLGDRHQIFADRVDRLGEKRLRLSGRIVLNDWIVLRGELILDSEIAPRTDSKGMYWERGAIYSDRELRMTAGTDAAGTDAVGTGAVGFDHGEPSILPGFSGAWDREDFFIREYPASIMIPHLGRVSATAKMEGDELRYQVESGALLDDLTEKLNGAIYGEEFSDESMNGLVAMADRIELQWSRDGIKYRGTARLTGWMGPMRVREATIDIDSERSDLFRIHGDLSASHLPSALDLGPYIGFEIGSKGKLPDSLKMKSLHLGLDQKVISERSESEPFASKSGIAVADLLPEALRMEPLRSWFALYPLYFDRSELVNAPNENQNAIRLWQGTDAAHSIEIRPEGTVIAVSEERERAWLGSRFGGEIRGEVLVQSSEILVRLNIDGHLDVPELGIRFDGLSTLSVRLRPYQRDTDLLTVRISNGDQIVEYRSTWNGAVHGEKKEAR